MYDANQHLLFYIENENVRTSSGTVMGTLADPGYALNLNFSTTEYAIVPYPDNQPCAQEKYYVFWILADPTTGGPSVKIFYAIVDMNANSGAGSVSSPSTQLNNNTGYYFGSLAVSPRINANGDRFLYAMRGRQVAVAPDNNAYGTLQRFTISASGISGATNVLGSGSSYPLNIDYATLEMDLSPAGDKLVWGGVNLNSQNTYNYSIISLNASGNYINNSLVQFNAGSTSSVPMGRGVEFDQNGTKLFIGAGDDGVYWTSLSGTPNPQQISGSNGSNGLGHSQLELAYNGKIYAGTPGYIKAIDPTLPIPVLVSSYDITYTAPKNPANTNYGLPDFYVLPDQIDGENYDNILQPHISWSADNFIATTNATWTMAQNPITGTNNPPVIIIKTLLSIPSGVNITLDHMHFEFGTGARVTIAQNASLTVNGGTLTSSECGTMWEGIEVWGHINQSQFTAGAQGKLMVRFGATISNALKAVANWNPNGGFATDGGIITVIGAHFKNNKRSVEFKSYYNYNPSNANAPYANLSSFANSDFIVDDNYIGGLANPFLYSR